MEPPTLPKSPAEPNDAGRGRRYALRIGHTTGEYHAWKVAFDQDPLDRAAHGVRRYRVFRSVDEPTYVAIDLEFDSFEDAKAFSWTVQQLWRGEAGKFVDRPELRLVEIQDVRELGTA